MFVYSIRASTVRFFAVVALTLVLLVGILAFGNAGDVSAASGSIDFSGISNVDDRIAFISQFGLVADQTSEESEEFRVPENFDRVIAGYNEIQRAQGLNLKRYAGKDATAYVYKLKNHGTAGEVYATLFIRNGRVIAGDVSSKEGEGFVNGLQKQ